MYRSMEGKYMIVGMDAKSLFFLNVLCAYMCLTKGGKWNFSSSSV